MIDNNDVGCCIYHTIQYSNTSTVYCSTTVSYHSNSLPLLVVLCSLKEKCKLVNEEKEIKKDTE